MYTRCGFAVDANEIINIFSSIITLYGNICDTVHNIDSNRLLCSKRTRLWWIQKKNSPPNSNFQLKPSHRRPLVEYAGSEILKNERFAIETIVSLYFTTRIRLQPAEIYFTEASSSSSSSEGFKNSIEKSFGGGGGGVVVSPAVPLTSAAVAAPRAESIWRRRLRAATRFSVRPAVINGVHAGRDGQKRCVCVLRGKNVRRANSSSRLSLVRKKTKNT